MSPHGPKRDITPGQYFGSLSDGIPGGYAPPLGRQDRVVRYGLMRARAGSCSVRPGAGIATGFIN